MAVIEITLYGIYDLVKLVHSGLKKYYLSFTWMRSLSFVGHGRWFVGALQLGASCKEQRNSDSRRVIKFASILVGIIFTAKKSYFFGAGGGT